MRARRLSRLSIALAIAVSLAPMSGGAALDEKSPITGTTCSVGNESFDYDVAAQLFRYSSQVTCGATPQASIELGLASFRAVSGTKAFFAPTVICANCQSAQTSATATKAMVADDTYILKSTVKVKVNAAPAEKRGFHGNCYRVHGTTVVLLLNGCSLN